VIASAQRVGKEIHGWHLTGEVDIAELLAKLAAVHW